MSHRREPDVGIEADLMRGVTREHGAATRLRNIPDEKAAPAILRGFPRQALNQGDEDRVPPATIAREAHGLPVRPVTRDGDTAGKTPFRIEAIGCRPGGGGELLGSEQLLGERFGLNGGNRGGKSQQGHGHQFQSPLESHRFLVVSLPPRLSNHSTACDSLTAVVYVYYARLL